MYPLRPKRLGYARWFLLLLLLLLFLVYNMEEEEEEPPLPTYLGLQLPTPHHPCQEYESHDPTRGDIRRGV
jgi:hypothetical protein